MYWWDWITQIMYWWEQITQILYWCDWITQILYWWEQITQILYWVDWITQILYWWDWICSDLDQRDLTRSAQDLVGACLEFVEEEDESGTTKMKGRGFFFLLCSHLVGLPSS